VFHLVLGRADPGRRPFGAMTLASVHGACARPTMKP